MPRRFQTLRPGTAVYDSDYRYADRMPLHVSSHELDDRQKYLLTQSPSFCMLPWIHLHAYPDGKAYPCCYGEYSKPIGDFKTQTMREVWNSRGLRNMRRAMLEGRSCAECTKCYEQEQAGMTSARHSHSQNFGHNIGLVDETKPDGSLDRFELRYYDVRFSNICNFRCRTCGETFSSNWHADEQRLNDTNHVFELKVAGRNPDDMWQQMQEHIPHLEQIYFAGGEPLIMEEHYRLLNELIRIGRKDVRLIYNTNFSRLTYKDQDVLELWRHFDDVNVGASLDGSGARGEYIRKGMDWPTVIDNRARMKQKCPHVKFHVNCTVSVFNALHVADFHKELVELDMITADEFNINPVHYPYHYRTDILPPELKRELGKKINQHLAWLEPLDHMRRATTGFQGLINFTLANDGSQHRPRFYDITGRLDNFREEDFYYTFPELQAMKQYDTTTR